MVIASGRLGELIERIELQSKQYVPDGLGGGAMSLVTIASVWAKVEALSGAEGVQHARVEDKTAYKITIRYIAGLGGIDVIMWRGIEHNVISVLDNGPRSLHLEIMAEQGVAI